MVSHGTQKKRRSGTKQSRKTFKKHREVRIYNAINNTQMKEQYDKNKSPAANMAIFGLVSDSNRIAGQMDPTKKQPAFCGYASVVDNGETFADRNVKRRKMTEVDMEYALKNITKHGTDYDKMMMDILCNERQFTAQKLKTLCENYYKYKESSSAE